MNPPVGGDKSQPPSYPIASDVQTTRERVIVPDPIPADAEKIFPHELAK